MKLRFADTSFYISLVNERDSSRAKALELMAWRGQVMTTLWVLVELGNYLSRASDRGAFLRIAQTIAADPNTRVIDAGMDLYREGFDLYAACIDKDWSMTDCISFVVMKREGIAEALTTDHHFEQAGFVALLK